MHQHEGPAKKTSRALFHHADGYPRLGYKTVLSGRYLFQFTEPRPEVGCDGRQVRIGEKRNKGAQTDSVADLNRYPYACSTLR